MKAIQITKTGGPEVLTLAEVPTPKPKPNEVLVKISFAGINYIDVYFREGRYPKPVPFVNGQEASGVVSELGADVKSFKVGDRVAYTGILGAYAEYEAIPEDRLVAVPEGVTDRQAAAAMLQGMTAHYLVHSTYPLKHGETTLIHAAAGGVGLLLVQMAKNLGARVIATVSTDEKAKLAREAGADEVILYTHQDFEAETKRLTDGKGVHVIYDGVGLTTFEKDLNILRPRGYLVLFGASSGAVPPLDLLRLTQKGSLCRYAAYAADSYIADPRRTPAARRGCLRDDLKRKSEIAYCAHLSPPGCPASAQGSGRTQDDREVVTASVGGNSTSYES